MIEELIKNLKGYKDYYYTWQANIAMAFLDTYCQYKTKMGKEPTQDDIHEIANTSARYFLDLLCKDANTTQILTGEDSLAREWLLPEEDEAWKDL